MLKVTPLFSGSKGNCTLIQTDNTNILLDAGFSYRTTVKVLQQFGLTPKDVSAIVITHEHSDHIGALPLWTRTYSTPIYAPTPIADYIRQRVYFAEVYEIDDNFSIGDVSVEVFECSHDARCCFGYRFNCGLSHFACVTDTGCVTDQLVEFLSPCNTIMLESNHDVDMLVKGEYPYPLKRRILSDFGHLSNTQAVEVLRQLIGSSVKNVILAHLSEKNNTREIAFNLAVQMYQDNGIVEGKDIWLYVVDQYKNEVSICLD